MKTFENFNIDEKEKLFLKLSHLDELEIKFDFNKIPKKLCYFYKTIFLNKKICLFEQEKISNKFFINDDEIWSVFELKFGLNWTEIRQLMNGMVEKHFKLYKYNIIINYPIDIRLLNKIFV